MMGIRIELVACELFLGYFEAAERESGIRLVVQGRGDVAVQR